VHSSPASAAEGAAAVEAHSSTVALGTGTTKRPPSRARAPSDRRSRCAGSRAGSGRSRAWSRRSAPARGSQPVHGRKSPLLVGCGRRRSRAGWP
jgi:hypothetical protein